MIMSVPTSLASFLKSHRRLLERLNTEGNEASAEQKLSQKAVIPYDAINKVFDSEGRPADYIWTLQDFNSPFEVNGGNILGRDYERYTRALKAWDGDVRKALASLNISEVPLTGEEAYARLREEWAQLGLTRAFDVLHRYQVSFNFLTHHLTEPK